MVNKFGKNNQGDILSIFVQDRLQLKSLLFF